MINFLICLILNILITFGIAIAIVEKSNEWPLKYVRIIIQKFIHDYISWKASSVLFCSTCSSFWISLIVDILIGIISFFIFGQLYFLWPLSGFASVGFTWFVIEFLNGLDKDTTINLFADDFKK